MKIVSLSGGLGNQMFMYAFCLGLRAKDKKTLLFVPVLNNSKAYGHQGYELEKLFHIYRFDGLFSKISNLIIQIYSQIIRVFPNKWNSLLYKFLNIHLVKVPENFIYYQNVFSFKNKHEFFRGTWQSESYFKDAKDEVRKQFEFNQNLLSWNSIQTTKTMLQSNSVSIHIRRGDYLSDNFKDGFGGVCTDEYYTKAIQFIKEKIEIPVFYVFTDDKDWVSNNFELEGALYINSNTGIDSWQDMYLMSQCKHNIIANSSFSWWGAWLNSNEKKIVIAPKLWWKLFEKDDVVPDSWIRL